MLIILVVLILQIVAGTSNQKSLKFSVDGRIVGGKDANITDYPYQVALYDDLRQCGGVILSLSWILTAAHCVFDIENKFQIRAGSSKVDTDGETVKVTEIFVHPDYDETIFDYDIAALKLSEDINVRNAVPIPLPEINFTLFAGELVTVTGWGHLSEDGDNSEVLQVVEVPVVNQKDCQEAYVNDTITDRMFCAGLLGTGGKDACVGDSGGPAVIDGLLAGLVSTGKGCAKPDYPGIYTNIRQMRSWINEITGL